MASQTLTLCFTDLTGSTATTESLGNDNYRPNVLEFFKVGRQLADFTGGNYLKDVGDGHVVTFADAGRAMQFAMLLQEYYVVQPCRDRLPLGVKIGLAQGEVDVTSDDVSGSGANEAARVLGKSGPGQVIINSVLHQALTKIWGPTSVAQYFSTTGIQTLAGITNPPEQELYAFSWPEYATDHPQLSLSSFVMRHLERARVEPSRVSVRDLAHPGVIIWPVVPRDLVTAIHQGQAEMIRLLTSLGWQVNLIIADCGAPPKDDRGHAKAFQQKLETHLAARDIKAVQTSYMSDLYNPAYSGYERLQQLFKEISSRLTLADFLNINNKSYTLAVTEEIEKNPTLDCLRPALTLAAILYFVGLSQRKAIVVAGFDERIQWDLIYRHPNTQDQLGVLMNPVFNVSREHQARQHNRWPSWVSRSDLRRDMDAHNLAWWAFHLHAFLPVFPAEAVAIGSERITPEEWPESKAFEFPQQVDKDELATIVWNLLGLTS